MEIKAKTFLVTGGAQGMGRSFTVELAKLGANVMFCDLNADKIAEVEETGCCIRRWCQRWVLNVAERDEVVDGEIVYGIDKSTVGFKAFIEEAVNTFGDVHGIINNLRGIIRDGMMAKKIGRRRHR